MAFYLINFPYREVKCLQGHVWEHEKALQIPGHPQTKVIKGALYLPYQHLLWSWERIWGPSLLSPQTPGDKLARPTRSFCSKYSENLRIIHTTIFSLDFCSILAENQRKLPILKAETWTSGWLLQKGKHSNNNNRAGE